MKLKEIVSRMALVFLAIAVPLLMTEIALRIAGYHYRVLDLNDQTITDVDRRQYHSEKDELCVFDPYLIWQPKKGHSIINAMGFRGNEPSIKKNPGEYYIFAIGDSNTAGSLGWPCWADYLNQICAQGNPHIKVINAGVWGYTSYQGLRYFKELLVYKPDMILVCFGVNDGLMVAFSDRAYLKQKRFLHSWVAHSRLVELFIALSDKIKFTRGAKDTLVPRVDLAEYENNLKEILAVARMHHIGVVFLSRPLIDYIPEYQQLWISPLRYNEVTVKVARTGRISFIDLYDCFKEKKEFFADNNHFNDAGCRVAAQIIYAGIEKNLRP